MPPRLWHHVNTIMLIMSMVIMGVIAVATAAAAPERTYVPLSQRPHVISSSVRANFHTSSLGAIHQHLGIRALINLTLDNAAAEERSRNAPSFIHDIWANGSRSFGDGMVSLPERVNPLDHIDGDGPLDETLAYESLRDLYMATQGALWSRRENWLVANTSICTWYGVVCNHTTVIQLLLPYNHLNGTLPSSFLTGLPDLVVLDLESNYLHGRLISFAPCHHLTVLRLNKNNLGGEITDFSWAHHLQIMDMGSNQLNGTVPTINSSRLLSLDLSDNQLTGFLPSFESIPNLRALSLAQNYLYGTIHSFAALPYLNELLLGENQFDGELPSSFTHDSSLTSLNLGDNYLSGPLPLLTGATSMIVLNLTRNRFTGGIPLYDHMTYLSLIDISQNQLSGSIPDFHHRYLTDLFLNNNNINGSLPTFTALPYLQKMDLSGNYITGVLPNYAFVQARDIRISYNQLRCDMPPLNMLPNLQILQLSDNFLTGILPPNFLANSSSLTALSLARNNITGTISSFRQFADLESLYLPFNRFTGTIPQFWSNNLEEIVLAANKFEGEIPSFSQVPLLRRCDLSDNQLTGTIDKYAFTSLYQLQLLDLSENQLTGSIPDLSSLPSLRIIFLDGNRLTGNMVPMNLPLLSVLNIGRNQLTGTLPTYGYSTTLATLDVSNNRLTGHIPCAILLKPNLISFFGFDNQFTGIDCNSIGNSLLDVDLSRNLLAGAFNDKFRFFLQGFVQSLRLSSNFITGYIPDIGDPSLPLGGSTLVELDLSSNPGLTGTLPITLRLVSVLNFYNTSLFGPVSAYFVKPGSRVYTFNGHSTKLYIADDEMLDLINDDTREYFVTPETAMLCPARQSSMGGFFNFDPQFWRYRSCLCPTGWWDTQLQQCRPCGDHIICDPRVTSPVHRVMSGYYPINTTNGEVVINPSDIPRATLLLCDDESFCNPNPQANDTFTCGAGHELSMLCSACDADWYRIATMCVACDDYFGWLAPLLAVTFYITVVLFLITRQVSLTDPAIPIFFFWTQLNGSLRQSSFGDSPNREWVGHAMDELSKFRAWAIVCAVPDFTYQQQMYFAVALPFILSSAAFILAYIAHVIKGQCDVIIPGIYIERATSCQRARRKTVFVMTWLCMIMYFPLLELTFGALTCRSIDDTHVSYLGAAPWLSCGPDDDQYTALLAFTLPFILIWAFGVPALFVHQSRGHHIENAFASPAEQHPMKFLWHGYRHDYYWWDAIILPVRKVALVIVLVLIDRRSAFAPLITVSLLLIAIVIHTLVQPYRRRFDNVLETVCLCHSTLLFLANTLVHIASRDRLQDGEAALRVLTTMNYAVTLGLLLIILSRSRVAGYIRHRCTSRMLRKQPRKRRPPPRSLRNNHSIRAGDTLLRDRARDNDDPDNDNPNDDDNNGDYLPPVHEGNEDDAADDA